MKKILKTTTLTFLQETTIICYTIAFGWINLDALYMIDNTLGSLDFTDWIWGFQLNLSYIIIPKN